MKRKHDQSVSEEQDVLGTTEADATRTATTTAAASFLDIGLDSRLLSAVADQGFQKPTDVQARTIPAVLDGSDVVARARTGSGKTAAYVLPILQRILACKEVLRLRIQLLQAQVQPLI
jgi:superfamily II DNA/RNA helicase